MLIPVIESSQLRIGIPGTCAGLPVVPRLLASLSINYNLHACEKFAATLWLFCHPFSTCMPAVARHIYVQAPMIQTSITL